MAFFGRDNHEDLNYIEDQPTNSRQATSTSFLLDVSPDLAAGHSHSSPGVLTHTPTSVLTPSPTEMPRPDQALDHIVDLFDDVQKIFERYPPFDVNALSAGSELLASEHVTSREGDRVIPAKDTAVFTEDDFSSHRSNSFPHIHHPLRPLRSKSHKNVQHGDHHKKKKKKKKKRRMHVTKSFPSKSALQSPPIPEDDEEYYSSSDSESDSSTSRRNSLDMMDGPLVITEPDDLDPSSGIDLERALGDIPPEPSTTSTNSSQLEVRRSTTPERRSFGRKVADFFIGENESSPPREVSSTPSVENAPFDFTADKMLAQTSSSMEEQFQLSDIGNTEQEPLLSQQAQYKVGSSRSLLDDGRSRVHFSVGGDDSSVNLMNISKDESAPSIPSLNKHSKASLGSEGSGKSGKSHRHKRHHHHDHYKTEDLLLRRQKGSEVHLDVMKSEPTEVDEAKMLHKVDLDEMASHRLDNLHGMRRHRVTKNHSAMSSIVHIGKHKKTKHKIFQPRKKFDHRPHEMFVELDELYEGEGENYEWREKARWIKFEEDVEEGAERWGKPHVASLSFHSLLELRRGLENGTLILDLEAEDLPSIVNYVVNDMVIHDHIKSEHKGKVLKTLLMKHKHRHVGDKMKTFIRRNISYMNLSGLDGSTKSRLYNTKSNMAALVVKGGNIYCHGY